MPIVRSCRFCGKGFIPFKGAREFCGDQCRFWAKVDKDGPIPADQPELGPCWVWIASRSKKNGYGRFGLQTNGRSVVVSAPRFALELALGRTLTGWALHHCDNPSCVRPNHLYEGTPASNVDDMMSRGRGPTGDRSGQRRHPERYPAPEVRSALGRVFAARGEEHGLRKHPECAARGEQHGNAQLTQEDVLAIRSRAAAGEPHRILAAAFDVHHAHVRGIVHRRYWKHVP